MKPDARPDSSSAICALVADWVCERLKHRRAGRAGAYVLGLTGAQGTGKTTLAAALPAALAGRGYRAVNFSIDDIYKTRAEREALRASCPHYRFRGPYGTHDVALGIETIRALKRNADGEVVYVPVFDKSLHGGMGDRLASNAWRAVTGRVDVVIFEGWCLGARPLPACELEQTVNAIEASAEYDASGTGEFRRRINDELMHYQPLFAELDDLVVLHPEAAGSVYRWRQEQEDKLARGGAGGMDQATLRRFVDYFMPVTERYILPLGRVPPPSVSLVIRLGEQHEVQAVVDCAARRGGPDIET